MTPHNNTIHAGFRYRLYLCEIGQRSPRLLHQPHLAALDTRTVGLHDALYRNIEAQLQQHGVDILPHSFEMHSKSVADTRSDIHSIHEVYGAQSTSDC